MLNIVVPMAGRGSRFQEAGYALPKPLIPIHGRPMIEIVIENIRPNRDHRFIFLCLDEHLQELKIADDLEKWAPGSDIVPVKSVTEGAACTVLLAESLIDNDDPMMIANSDQWVEIDINDYLAVADSTGCDGLIMTMWADHPKWSYLKFDAQGEVSGVVEKVVVSNEATVGIYNYRRGRDFVAAAKSMIAKGLRVNGEFYVAPAYNEMLEWGASLEFHNIGREYAGMHGLGTPTDLTLFESSPVSQRVAPGYRVDSASAFTGKL